MKEKISVMLKWAVFGNLAHLIVAMLNTQIDKENTVPMLLLTGLALFVWTFFGFKFGSTVLKGKETDYLVYGILCVLPMLVYNLSGQILQGRVEGFTLIQNYSLFYFLGAPVLFWNTPFYPIMKLFPDSNIYIQMNINLLLVVLISFIGAFIGNSFRLQQLRNNKKKQLD